MTFFVYSKTGSDDGERPFWISYADLMSALMVLFLVIMVAALSSINNATPEVRPAEPKPPAPPVVEAVEKPLQSNLPNTPTPTAQRSEEIASMCDQLARQVEAKVRLAFVDCKLNRISFGEAGRYPSDVYRLGSDGVSALNEIVPVIMRTANTELGKKWLKRVLVEGYTDTDGSYLYNLNLSLKRSEWVLCQLIGDKPDSPIRLTRNERRSIKKLFMAGGVSFNHIRETKDASRRVELKLEFYGLDERPDNPADYEAKFDPSINEKCYL
ncbi:MAG: hypothetical protein HC848_08685 [Limnobacter sp.]|nr:hypothetical protein [Limnobacter sp.]